jgi:hypothetical protein
MNRRTSILKYALAAIALVAPSLTMAPVAASPVEVATAQELASTPDPCGDGRPSGGVYCSENRNPGGPTGCFFSACDAHRVGAFHCRKTTSACEPQ